MAISWLKSGGFPIQVNLSLIETEVLKKKQAKFYSNAIPQKKNKKSKQKNIYGKIVIIIFLKL